MAKEPLGISGKTQRLLPSSSRGGSDEFSAVEVSGQALRFLRNRLRSETAPSEDIRTYHVTGDSIGVLGLVILQQPANHA